MLDFYGSGTSQDRPEPGDTRYIPYDAPDPGPAVQIVTIIEEEPERLRWVRTSRGWRRSGFRQWESGIGGVVPWSEVGLCTFGTKHALKDVTGRVRDGCGCGCSNCTGPGCGCCSNC